MINVKRFKSWEILWECRLRCHCLTRKYDGRDIKIEMKNGSMFFPPFCITTWKVQNNTRVFYLKELGSIDEYQWRVFRTSNISITLDGDIENFQEFTISQQQQKSREITRPARVFIYCNGPPLKFNDTYMHHGASSGQISHAVTSGWRCLSVYTAQTRGVTCIQDIARFLSNMQFSLNCCTWTTWEGFTKYTLHKYRLCGSLNVIVLNMHNKSSFSKLAVRCTRRL